jgi:hypothetical protein
MVNMSKIEKIHHAKDLLNQAMKIASDAMPNNRDIVEAKHNIQRAISNIEDASKKHKSKKQNGQDQFEKWWGSIQSGVSNMAHTSISKEATQKTLSQLNAMIREQTNIIDSLENNVKNSNAVQSNEELLIE